VHDPHADAEEVKKEYGIDLVGFDEMKDLSALVIAVGHDQFKSLSSKIVKEMLSSTSPVMDIKSHLGKDFSDESIHVWRM
jgi:UDP-N-acetyl-D-galactosamine dehydrogenase